MSLRLDQLERNLGRVRDKIAIAAAAAGRTPQSVMLVAITKYESAEVAAALVQLGCRSLGESRPQELWRKGAALADLSIEWHLIGHLQRNKVRRTVELASWIHSVDQLSLLDEIESQPLERPLNCLVEINMSGDSTKHGLQPDQAEPFLIAAAGYTKSQVRGLMTMAAREGDLESARQSFAGLRELRDRLRSRLPGEIRLDELSMGMSGDFEIAIREGATMIRIGSTLFDEIA